jgi:hypothetical protein
VIALSARIREIRGLLVWDAATRRAWRIAAIICLTVFSVGSSAKAAEELLVLQADKVELVVAPAGGAVVAFRFRDGETNPLNFEIPPPLPSRQKAVPLLRGHFLCLDRWGAPSTAEQAHGMPYHGEAAGALWKVDRAPQNLNGRVSAEMSCELPLAGMRVARRVVLDEAGSAALVTEQVTNTNKLGRIYNMVQHPSIAPPFLNDDTLVDSNARAGFLQDRPIPTSRDATHRWPKLEVGGTEIDLRHLRTEPGDLSDVSSFVFSDNETHGWVTASSPRHKLLLGYVWKTADYPWLNIWRFRAQGKPAARGLEFGTTGYHQPFPVLVKQGPILDRPTYAHLDADETVGRSYLCFLARIPADFEGVGELRVDAGVLKMRERREVNSRAIELTTGLTSDAAFHR